MIRKVLLSVILLCCSQLLNAQSPVYQSSFRIAGTNDETGDFIKTDASGNIYVAGTFGSGCDFDPGAGISTMTPSGTTNIYLAKYTSAGNLIWKYSIGGSTEFLRCMEMDPNGDIYLGGDYYNTMTIFANGGSSSHTSIGGGDAFVIKFDTAGHKVFSFSFGASNTESCKAIEFASNGDFYISGESSSSLVDLDPGPGFRSMENTTNIGINPQAFISRFNSAGNFLWAKVFHNSGSSYLRSFATDSQGRLIAGGFFTDVVTVDSASNTILTSPTSSADPMIIRFDSNGIFENAWTFGGPAVDNLSLIETYNDEIIAAGTFNSTIDIDPGAGTNNITSYGTVDAFLCKLDVNGTFVWGGNIGGVANDFPIQLNVNNIGEIYLAGFFTDNAYFDLGTQSGSISSYGGRDGFISKFSNSGSRVYTMKLGGINGDNCQAIAFAGNSDFYTTGHYFDAQIKLDPTNPGIVLPNVNQNDVFVAKYNDSLLVTGISAINHADIKVYPNPAKNYLQIEVKNQGQLSAEILDITGRNTGLHKAAFTESVQFNTTELSSGVYILSIRNSDNEVYHYRFIKE